MPYEIALDELMHHGILGMKWGKRNGPPYPLEYKKLSPEEKEKAKSKAIREGNIKEAAANINEFTNEELRQLRDRFNLNQDIAKITASTKKTGAQKVDKAIDWINRGVRAADAGSKAYNAFAKVVNALNADEESQLPLIGEKKQPRNKAEGKTKQQMLDMVKSGRLSTKDYKDISERMEAINKTEEYFKPKKKITQSEFYNMIDNPENYTADQVNDAWSKFKTVTAAKKTDDYKEYDERRKEERDYYGFYHSLTENLEHSAKGTTWSKKDHKYVSKEKNQSGKVIYKYLDNKKQIDHIKEDVNELRTDAETLQADAAIYDEMANDANEYLRTGKAANKTYTFSDGTKIKTSYAKIFKRDTTARQEATKNLTTARDQSASKKKEASKKYESANNKMKTVTKLSRENAAMIHDSFWHKFKTSIKINARKAKRWIEAAATWIAA